MMYELVSRARELFDLGFADGFGFNAKTGEFWVSRGGEFEFEFASIRLMPGH